LVNGTHIEIKGSTMSDQQNEHTPTTDVDVSPTGLNASRRKLVRAGLAAAPVVAAFKSNMVLASPRGTNVTVLASSFASVTTTGGSVAPNARTTGLFIPMSECEKHKSCDELLFGPTGCDRSHKRGCGFDMAPSPSIATKTLKQVFKMNPHADMERLARYLSAGYLSAMKYGSDSYISEQRCKDIWRNYGSWEPTAGVRWSLSDTCDYFERVYSGTGFSDCLINPASRSDGRRCV
jgi:hypothetical protein